MKAKAAAIHGGLAGVALLAAFATWQREPDAATAEDMVVALDIGKSDLQEVRLQTPELKFAVKRQDDQVWVHAAPVPKPPPAPANAADGGTPSPGDAGVAVVQPPPLPPQPPPVPPRDMRGNALAEKALEKFAPLRALRALGKQPPEKLKEMGLEDPKRTLTVVQRNGRETVFKVSNAVLGIGAPYLMAPDGSVYLVPTTMVSQLEGGQTQLVDRTHHAFKQNEVDEVVVKAGDKQREFSQTTDDQGVTRLTQKKDPSKAEDLARNWNDKVFRLTTIEVLGKGETPLAGEPKVEGRVEYLRRGKLLGWMDLARGANNELYVRSEHTAGWVKSSNRADDVLGEIKKVVEPT